MPAPGRVLNEIAIIRGASKTFQLIVRNENSEPVDLTGAEVYFTVKKMVSDQNPLIFKKSDDPLEAEVLDQVANNAADKGKANIYLVPDDTANVAVGKYVYDCWVKLASGKQYPVIRETTFEVKWNVSVIV